MNNFVWNRSKEGKKCNACKPERKLMQTNKIATDTKTSS